MIIKILGSGCKNCASLEKNVEKAIKDLVLEAEIIKVEDFEDIMKYGVMSTPALVVDEKVVSSGKILKVKEIIKILNA